MHFNSVIFNKDTEFLQEIFAHISKFSNNDIIITDEKLNIIYQNSKYTFKNAIFSLSDLMPNYTNENINTHFENFKSSAKNHIFFKLIFNDEHNNFQNIPLDVHICKIKNQKNRTKGYTVIIQDITQELRNKIQKETFIDILTHDLKNPMRANIQILELILNNKFGELNENLQTILDELLNSCRFINYMTDNLLIKYKNELTMYEIQKQYYSIVDLIKEKSNNLLSFFERRNQHIEFTIKNNVPKLNFDIEEVGKVINNLLINASEQSSENSSVIIEIEKINNNVYVSFLDNGYPQSDESLGEIFEEYITCANKFRKIGFGLELYNCKKIIEAHNGKIWAKNNDNCGTAITFYLPIISKVEKN